MAGPLATKMDSPPHNGSHIDTQSQEERAQLASLVDFDPGYMADVPTITVAYVADRPHPTRSDAWVSRMHLAANR